MPFLHITHKGTVDVAERHTTSAPTQIFNFTATCWQPTPFLSVKALCDPTPTSPSYSGISVHPLQPDCASPSSDTGQIHGYVPLTLVYWHFHTCDRGHLPGSYRQGTRMLSDF